MSCENTFEGSGLYMRFFDTVTGEDIINNSMSFYGEPYFDKMRYVIVDFLAIKDFEMTYKQIDEISAYDNASALSNPRVKVAIAAKTEHVRIAAKLYIAKSQESPWKFEVFDNLDDARQWTLS